jgi:NADPH:quinone reductase-like Zn-dependent oxidoreductase
LEIGENTIAGGLKGKTVFIPAGLSGTGGFGVQLAKNYFGAGKVITTVSTSKVPIVTELLGESVVDQVIDYTQEDVVTAIGPGTVDFMFDTMGYTFPCLSVLKRGGMVVSITTMPSGAGWKALLPDIPWWLFYILNFVNYIITWRIERHGIKYTHIFTKANGDTLENMSKMMEEGTLKPLVGSVVKMEDIKAVREACAQVFTGKGGVGKLIIEVA